MLLWFCSLQTLLHSCKTKTKACHPQLFGHWLFVQVLLHKILPYINILSMLPNLQCLWDAFSPLSKNEQSHPVYCPTQANIHPLPGCTLVAYCVCEWLIPDAA